MPFKPQRQCPGRGKRRGACPNFIRGNERCCSECKPYEVAKMKAKSRQYDKERDQRPDRQFIHSTQWQRIRVMKLGRDPLCQWCLQKNPPRETPATLVHHIDHDELNNDWDNLLSACNPCHQEEHKQDQWRKRELRGEGLRS